MPVAVGDKLPDITLRYLTTAGNLSQITAAELSKGKKAILIGVPGAFTPTCSKSHVPGFITKAAEFKAKGIDTIAVVSLNDPFVMDAWRKDLGVGEEILFLADGNGELTKALDIAVDLEGFGLGVRMSRFAALLEDGEVKVLNLEDGGGFTCSSADKLFTDMS